MRPHNILTIVFANTPCAQLGILLPFEKLAAEGNVCARVYTTGKAPKSDVAWADLVVLQRVFSHLDMEILLEARRLGKPVVYDIDDNLLDVPLSLGPIAKMYADEGVRHNIKMFLSLATLVKTSTLPLADALAPLTRKPPLVLSPMNPDTLYTRVKNSRDGVFRFVYAGDAANYHALEKVAGQAMRRIMETYGDKVHFYFFGGKFREIDFPKANATFIPPLPIRRYIKVFTATTADAGIACLEDTPFNRCKSNLKFREYGARGLAGLYSDISIYAECVEHGRTGLLVKNTEDSWYDAMASLVENPAYAHRLGANARDVAEREYTMDRYTRGWLEQVLDPLICGGTGSGDSHLSTPV